MNKNSGNSELTEFMPVRPKAVRVQIYEHVKKMILDGRLVPGTKLPPTQVLAREWNTQAAIVQLAINPLMKEGLVTRSTKTGTIVCQKRRLNKAGIYFFQNVWNGFEFAFERTVWAELMKLLSGRGVEVEVFTDTRPAEKHNTALPELKKAAQSGSIQAVFVPTIDIPLYDWLMKLSVPVSCISNANLRNTVMIDSIDFIKKALTEVHRLGCRNIGFISLFMSSDKNPDISELEKDFFLAFHRILAEYNMETRPEWIKSPDSHLSAQEVERFGYESMMSILEGEKRPEGVILFTDIVGRGAMVALNEMSVKVPEEMELVIHRNREAGFFNTVPVSFIDLKVSESASSMLKIVEAVMSGDKVNTIIQGFTTIRDNGLKSL